MLASMLESLVGESTSSYVAHAWFRRIMWTLVAACVLTFHPKRDRIVRRVCSTAGAAWRVLLRRARPAQRCTAPLGLLDSLPAELLPGLLASGSLGAADLARCAATCSALAPLTPALGLGLALALAPAPAPAPALTQDRCSGFARVITRDSSSDALLWEPAGQHVLYKHV